MLMQSLLKTIVEESQKRLLLIITAQINMMICLLSDITDCKLIRMGQFKQRLERFDPNESFKFIKKMFSSQADMSNTDLTFHVIKAPLTPSSHFDLFIGNKKKSQKLPNYLIGDYTRL